MKRILIISGLSIFIMLLFFINAKSQYSYDEPLQNISKEEEDIAAKDEDIENDEEETLAKRVTAEDPVRNFLTEKIQKAINTLFKREVQIVAIGDSLTQGVGDESENGGYVGILEERLNSPGNPSVTFTNLGKRGNRTDQLLQRLEEEEIQEEIESADIILLTIGANDIMHTFQKNITDLTLDKFNEELPSFSVRIQAIYDRMVALNEDANIYFIGFYNPYHHYFPDIPELDTIIESWNDEIRQFTETEERVTFIPVKDEFDNASFHFLAEDNFHPNHEGYRLFANRITQYLIESEGDLHEERTEGDED